MQVRTGMETGLAIAMILAFVAFRIREEFRWNVVNSFFYGFLGSIAILSRLDVALLIGPIVLYGLLTEVRDWPARSRAGLAIVLGLMPLVSYFLANVVIFHTLMPISGAAKQLRAHHLPSLYALHTFLEFLFAKNSPLLILQVGLTVLALLRFKASVLRRTRYPALFLGMLLFPFAHLLVITSASDWQLFLWYIYPWTVSFVAAGILLFAKSEDVAPTANLRRYEPLAIYCCGGFLICYGAMVTINSSPCHNLPYQAALEIRAFELQHPGIYGMGDRAGAVGYFGPQPVVQLEGLMMDREYLENIWERKELMGVLRKYHVRYYVSTRAEQDKNGCWHVKEPWQAGPDSPSMTAIICKTPSATFKHQQWINQVWEID
jgi:hypothetical protein